MPMMQVGPTSVAANASSGNVLLGLIYEFPPFNCVAEFGLEGSAAGLVVTVTTGTDIICQEMSVPSQNRFAIYPDDVLLNDVIRGGERITIVYRNTTVGALNAFTSVKLTPV